MESRGNAASGLFGIGIMVLPHSSGVKKFTNGSFAQGCGLGGIGMLIVRGETHLETEHYAQGCGIFGVGILQVKDGKNSSFIATRQAQGFAMTQGVGILTHQGDDTLIKGGLVDPDPREPLDHRVFAKELGLAPELLRAVVWDWQPYEEIAFLSMEVIFHKASGIGIPWDFSLKGKSKPITSQALRSRVRCPFWIWSFSTRRRPQPSH